MELIGCMCFKSCVHIKHFSNVLPRAPRQLAMCMCSKSCMSRLDMQDLIMLLIEKVDEISRRRRGVNVNDAKRPNLLSKTRIFKIIDESGDKGIIMIN